MEQRDTITAGDPGMARRRFIRGAAAGALALPAVVAATAGRAAAAAPSPSLTMYRPAEPYRCYDSRWTSVDLHSGLVQVGALARDLTRTVSVWPSFITTAGAGVFDTASSMPASTEILAITYNLTVVNTVGRGWLMVAAGGSVPSSSHVNWAASGQVVANAGTVQIFPGEFGDVQTMEVKAGGVVGSSTHFIVDITGWYEVPVV